MAKKILSNTLMEPGMNQSSGLVHDVLYLLSHSHPGSAAMNRYELWELFRKTEPFLWFSS